ncbi:shikimate kinase [Weissella viridescens]|uniref:Shikimate kinase n=1 Tax=Weissella viridescens TaxID=1629 RepID=A0A3P2REM8_WEIVI|nr:shikimate kinase [Weissella viridescens]RRG17875.1 shikimate kinase [Weissella viridescens]
MLTAILVGFMGAGKTTVGQALAESLNVPFYDTDALIQAQTQQTPGAIFAQDGEAAFREREQAVLQQALGEAQGVLATGGGIVEQPENLQLLKSAQIPVVYLDARFGTVAERLMGDTTRPILAEKSFQDVVELYQARLAKYQQVATFVQPVEQLTPDAIVSAIQQELEDV